MLSPDTLKTGAGRALRAVPFAIQRTALENLLALALREPCRQGDLDFLEDRCVKITVRDFHLSQRISLREGRLHILPPTAPWDVNIAGRARDFLLMATGREDPDTLFFQRRLTIEGDTELGLAVKNTLDSIGPLNLPEPLRRLIR